MEAAAPLAPLPAPDKQRKPDPKSSVTKTSATQPSATQPGKRERNRVENRNAILAAARVCFREQGYDKVTIRDIIRGTDLAAGTFYNYFTDKRDIFSALLTEFVYAINQNVHQLREAASSEQDFIHNTYLALFRAAAADPVVYELAHKNEQAIRELFGADIMGLAMSSLEDDVAQAIARGVLPHIDAEYLAAAFFGVAYEMSLRVARRARINADAAEAAATQAAQFATDLFIGGVERLGRNAR